MSQQQPKKPKSGTIRPVVESLRAKEALVKSVVPHSDLASVGRVVAALAPVQSRTIADATGVLVQLHGVFEASHRQLAETVGALTKPLDVDLRSLCLDLGSASEVMAAYMRAAPEIAWPSSVITPNCTTLLNSILAENASAQQALGTLLASRSMSLQKAWANVAWRVPTTTPDTSVKPRAATPARGSRKQARPHLSTRASSSDERAQFARWAMPVVALFEVLLAQSQQRTEKPATPHSAAFLKWLPVIAAIVTILWLLQQEAIYLRLLPPPH